MVGSVKCTDCTRTENQSLNWTLVHQYNGKIFCIFPHLFILDIVCRFLVTGGFLLLVLYGSFLQHYWTETRWLLPFSFSFFPLLKKIRFPIGVRGFTSVLGCSLSCQAGRSWPRLLPKPMQMGRSAREQQCCSEWLRQLCQENRKNEARY